MNGPAPRPHIVDATTALTVVMVLAVLIPAPEAVGFLGGAGTPAMIMCVLLALTWLGASLRYIPSVGTRCLPLRVAALFLAGSAVASWIAASSRRVTAAEIRAADRGLVVMLTMIGLALFTAELMRSRERLDVAIDRLIAAACVLAAIGIVQFNVQINIVQILRVPGLSIVNAGYISIGERSNFARVAGTTLHPVEFGSVLAMVLPLALHRAGFPPIGRSTFARFAPVVLLPMGILMSLSRTASLGVLVTLILLVPTWPRRRIVVTLFSVPAFLAVMRLVFPGLVGTGLALFTAFHQDPSVTARTSRYTLAGRMIREAPFFGRGIKTLLPPLVFDNQYVETIIEVGIIGLLALVGVFFVGISLVRVVRHYSDDSRTRDLAQSLTAAMTIPLVTYATWDALSFPVATIVTFLMIGFAGALWRLDSRQRAQEPVLVETEHSPLPIAASH